MMEISYFFSFFFTFPYQLFMFTTLLQFGYGAFRDKPMIPMSPLKSKNGTAAFVHKTDLTRNIETVKR